jgi:MTH538 TIR-like domain (DUF1863)
MAAPRVRIARRKTRIFVSYDFDHDRQLALLLQNQSKLPAAPFETANWSLKEAAPEAKWLLSAVARIKRCDVVLVLLGKHTHRAPGVRKEVAVARRLKKPIYQIKPRGTVATPVPNAGRVYLWTFDNLKVLLRPKPRVR